LLIKKSGYKTDRRTSALLESELTDFMESIKFDVENFDKKGRDFKKELQVETIWSAKRKCAEVKHRFCIEIVMAESTAQQSIQ
jgi:hypothetical protein